MSRMGSEFIRTADDRAAHDADEAARLRHEVKRLESIILEAALLLDEGDPLKMLKELGEALLFAEWDGAFGDVVELAATLRRVQALLKA